MKGLYKVLNIFAIAAVIALMGGCFSPWEGDGATITINVGAGGGRTAFPLLSDEAKANIRYTADIKGPSEMTGVPFETETQTLKLSVTPGIYTITVFAALYGKPYAEGSATAEAWAGQSTPVNIILSYVKEPEHEHVYSEEWFKDAEQHWLECICGDKADVADHDWDEWEETKASTETEEGEEKTTCAACGETEIRPIAPRNHECTTWWGDWKVNFPATCTDDGEEIRVCTLYENHIDKRPIGIDPDAHNWSAYNQTTAPTCTTAGVNTRVCLHNEDHEETQPIDIVSTAHNWGNWTETGKTRTCNNDAEHMETSLIAMVSVPGGSFQMGEDLGTAATGNVTPVHTVTLTGFSMGKYEVTQEQYEMVMGSNPSNFSSGPASGDVQGNRPVERVSWYDAIKFCNKLSMLEGLNPVYSISGSTDPDEWGGVPASSNETWNAVVMVSGADGYRLPTEAQWEYAAKGGNPNAPDWVGYTYSGSNTAGDVGWYTDNSSSKTHEVGKKLPNGLGIYDMSGNVYEWCWDRNGSYTSGAQTDPVGATSGSDRVLRGGYWGHFGQFLRSALRNCVIPSDRDGGIGFRLVRP
jgi:formylglycine-generating enzyme required for sulfatase activity